MLEAIRSSEQKTSGEIRVYIESRCKYVNPIDRASELFWLLQMDHTQERNAVLIYIASKDHQVAIWGDDGIHKIAGPDFGTMRSVWLLITFGTMLMRRDWFTPFMILENSWASIFHISLRLIKMNCLMTSSLVIKQPSTL